MDASNAYEGLDTLRIAHPKSGRPIMGFAIQSQLWFAGGETVPVRQAMVAATQDFAALGTGVLTQFQKDGASRYSAFRGDEWVAYYNDLATSLDPEDESFAITLTSEGYYTLTHAWGQAVEGDEAEDFPLSYWVASVPASWVKANLDAYVDAVLRWCALLRPEQGTCGPAPVTQLGAMRERKGDYWPFLARFTGLDMLFSFGLNAGDHAGLRTVNWLTILDDAYVADLGGVEAIQAALDPMSTLHTYEGGILIRACEHPQLGDRSLGNYPAPYKAIGAATAARRFTEYDDDTVGLIAVPEPMDALEETLDWVQRFDGDEM